MSNFLKAIEFVDAHCAGPLREERMKALKALLDEHEAKALEGKLVFTTKQLATLLKKTRQEQRGACASKFDFEEDQLLCLTATEEEA